MAPIAAIILILAGLNASARLIHLIYGDGALRRTLPGGIYQD